jgi:hypothetical protein
MASDDTPYELAHDASIRAIEDQANVLESLRSRAGTVLAATALVTSFLGGQAISRARQEDPHADFEIWSAAGGAIALFVVLALLTLAVLLPYRMRFSLSAASIIDIVDSRANDPGAGPVTPREAYREIALRNEAMYDFNAKRIRALLWCFRLAIVCLVGEVALWIVVLARGQL